MSFDQIIAMYYKAMPKEKIPDGAIFAPQPKDAKGAPATKKIGRHHTTLRFFLRELDGNARFCFDHFHL